MELDMDVNSDVVDHWLWLEMVRIEWLVGAESGNKVPDYFLDKGFLTGDEVEIRARDRAEDILDNLVILDLINPGEVETCSTGWTWRTG